MAIDELVVDIAEGFDELREEFLGSDAKLRLLRADGGSVSYSTIETILTGWSTYFREYFGGQTFTTFQVANIDSAFGDKVRKASHVVVIDSTNTALNNVLYALREDSQPPLGDEPFWKIRASATGELYTP